MLCIAVGLNECQHPQIRTSAYTTSFKLAPTRLLPLLLRDFDEKSRYEQWSKDECELHSSFYHFWSTCEFEICTSTFRTRRMTTSGQKANLIAVAIETWQAKLVVFRSLGGACGAWRWRRCCGGSVIFSYFPKFRIGVSNVTGRLRLVNERPFRTICRLQ